MKLALLSLSVVLLWSATARAQTDYAEAYRSAVERMADGAHADGLRLALMSDSLRPNHPQIMYLLAKAFLDNGLPAEAVSTLRKRASFYAEPDFADDPEFEEMSRHPGYFELMDEIRSIRTPTQTSKREFTVHSETLHAEGITYDATNRLFWIGDVRQGKILGCRPTDGSVAREIDVAGMGFWGVFGVAMDPGKPNTLWATTAALPQFVGYSDSLQGKTALLEIDLSSEVLVRSIVPDGVHLWGDLHFHPSGALFVTDSYDRHVYRIEGGGEHRALPIEAPFWSLQGLAASADGRFLYVADYVTGIFRVDLVSLEATPLFAENAKTKGTDGIYLDGSTLILLQNGTVPKRVSKVKLDASGLGSPDGFVSTDRGLPELDEPTLGVCVDGKVFYIANSPWPRYDQSGNPGGEPWPAIEVWSIATK